MKKFILILGLCLTASVNAGEFDCTMSKFSYILALNPLVPELTNQYREGDYKAIIQTEESLKELTADIYKDCEYITNTKALDAIVTSLASGTINLYTKGRKEND